MRNRIAALLSVLLLAAVGCTSFDIPDVQQGGEGDVAVITLVTPTGGGAYPGAETPIELPVSGYPAAADLSQPPAGYPEMTAMAPSLDVDPDELSPVPSPTPRRRQALAPESVRQTAIVEAVVRDLRQFLRDSQVAIEVVAAESVVWGNTGLGCPQEGMGYVEVQVEGMLITVEADGRTYTYHTDGGRNFVQCRDGRPVSSGTAPER